MLCGEIYLCLQFEVSEFPTFFSNYNVRLYPVSSRAPLSPTVKIERLGMKMREGRLRWYGHVMRRDQEYIGRKMMEMELPGKRRRGRPKRRFLDEVKEDMGEVGAKETDVEDRKMWRMMIRCGHP